MISYLISGTPANAATFKRTWSQGANRDQSADDGHTVVGFTQKGTYNSYADGREVENSSTSGSGQANGYGGTGRNGGHGGYSLTVSPDGIVEWRRTESSSESWGDGRNSSSASGSWERGNTYEWGKVTDSDKNEGGTTYYDEDEGMDTYSGADSNSNTFDFGINWTVYTTYAITGTFVTNITTTVTKYNIVGTTATDSGNSTATRAATTTSSWSEISEKTTKTNGTLRILERSTSSTNGFNALLGHGQYKTRFTVFELEENEVFFTLKANPASGFFGGNYPDPALWDSFVGPQTITISGFPHSKIPLVVVDVSVGASEDTRTAQDSTYTYGYRLVVPPIETTVYYPETTWYTPKATKLPLKSSFISTSIRVGWNGESYTEGGVPGTILSATFETVVGGASLPPIYQFPTTTVVDRSNIDHSTTLFGCELVLKEQTTYEKTIEKAVCRSKDFSTTFEDRGNETYFEAFGEEGETISNIGARDINFVGDFLKAAIRYNSCWETVGGGTSATSIKPQISFEINGVSENSWTIVSISAGVQTPAPEFGTLTLSGQTSKTTTTGIWGDEFKRISSTSDSNGVTTSWETTKINAGGEPYSFLQLGDNYNESSLSIRNDILNFPRTPQPRVVEVHGCAHISNYYAMVIPAGSYYNTTLDTPTIISGSKLSETYYMPIYAQEYTGLAHNFAYKAFRLL